MAAAIDERRRGPASTCSCRPAPAPASRWPTWCRRCRRRAGGGLDRDAGAAVPAGRPRPAPAGRRGRAAARPAAHLRRAQGPPPLPVPGQAGATPTEEEPDDALFDAGVRRRRHEVAGRGRPARQADRSGCATGPTRPRPATATSSTPASTTRPGGRSRCRPASASARRAARSARSASPRRPGPGPARPTSWSPTTACSRSTCWPAGTSCPPHKLLVIDEAHELADRVSGAAQAELTPELVDRAARRARPLIEPARPPSRWSRPATRSTVGLAEAPAGPAHRRAAAGAARGAARCSTRRPGAALERDRRHQGRRPRPGAQAAGQGGARRAVRRPRSGCWRSPSTTSPGSRSDDRPAAGRWWWRRCRSPARSRSTCTTTARSWPPRRRWRWAAGSTPVARALGLPAAAQPAAEPPAPSAATPPAGDDDADDRPWRSLDVGSPFDYPKQGILYVAAHLPRPAASGLPDAGRRRSCCALVRRARRAYPRALLLPPGRAAGRRAAAGRDRPADPAAGRGGAAAAGAPVPGGAERAACSASCRCGRASTCRATPASWWSSTGCRSRARTSRWPPPASAAVDAAGGSGFAAVSVPIAAVRLAQGVGRLIRADRRQGRGRGARLPAGDGPRLRRVPAPVAAAVLVHHQARGRRGALRPPRHGRRTRAAGSRLRPIARPVA